MLGLHIVIDGEADEWAVMIGWEENADGQWSILPDPMDPILACQTLEAARENDGYVWVRDRYGQVGVVAARNIDGGVMRDVQRPGMDTGTAQEAPVRLSDVRYQGGSAPAA